MQEHDTGCTEDSGRNLPGQPLPIPFISDSKHQPSLAAGTISASEDAAAAKVASLLNPAGPIRPVRLLLDFDGSLELAHELLPASQSARRSNACLRSREARRR